MKSVFLGPHSEDFSFETGNSYDVRSITRPQVGASEPTISANNLQSQKPARPEYYGQSIETDIIPCQTISFTLMRTVNGFEENLEMKFRKLAFKLHLYMGLVVGIFLAAIALTGSLLVFSPEIERFFNPQLLQVIPQAERIPLENVLQIVEKAYPENQAISILMPRSAKEVCQVSMLSKSEKVVSVYVNH